jgi:hypothetical protein
MCVRVELSSYHQSWDIPKEALRTWMPQSLLGQALEEDPQATIIHLTNPVVTPDIMHILAGLLEGKEPVKHNPDITPGIHYLNLPELLYYTDPLYDEIDRRSWNNQTNRYLLAKAAGLGNLRMVNYLLRKGVSLRLPNAAMENPIEPPRINLGSLALEEAIRQDRNDVVTLLLTSPELQGLYRVGLLAETIHRGALETFQGLLTDLNYEDAKTLIYQAIENDRLEMVKQLYPHLKARISDWTEGQDVFLCEHLEISKWLFDQPEMTPYLQEIFAQAVAFGYTDIVAFLMPKIDPTVDNYADFRQAISYRYTRIIPLFLKDPRIPSNNPQRAIASQMFS